MRSVRSALAGSLAGIAMVGAALVSAGGPAAAAPVEPLLADNVDDYSDYDGADTCSPSAKPGAVELLRLLTAAYPGTYGSISRDCPGPVTSEHQEGRAVDWMVSSIDEREKADDLFAWLFADDAYGNPNAMVRRLGIMYLIWDHHIWRAYDPGEGWQPYSGPNPHTDHVHLSMSWPGARQETTWTTGVDAGMRLDQAGIAATWRDSQRLDIFRRGQSGALETKVYTDRWSTWDDLGGDLGSAPAAVWTSSKKMWVFARGDDGMLHQRLRRASQGWGEWKTTDVPITAAPGVTTQGRVLNLFVRTPTGSVSHRTWTPKSERRLTDDTAGRHAWSPWEDLGGYSTSPPAAVWSSIGTLELFVRGDNGQLYQKVYRTGAGWSDSWSALGGVLTSGPSTTSTVSGETRVYVRTERGSIAERIGVGAWGPYVDIGGTHVSAAAATGLDGTRADLFTRQRPGGTAQNYAPNGSGWTGWVLR